MTAALGVLCGLAAWKLLVVAVAGVLFVLMAGGSIVSYQNGRVVIWAFAGGAATASIAAGLAAQSLRVIDFDDLAITVRCDDLEQVSKALRTIDPVSIHPTLPQDLAPSLKFGLCLPTEIAANVLKARTSDSAAVAATCRKTLFVQGLQHCLAPRYRAHFVSGGAGLRPVAGVFLSTTEYKHLPETQQDHYHRRV